MNCYAEQAKHDWSVSLYMYGREPQSFLQPDKISGSLASLLIGLIPKRY